MTPGHVEATIRTLPGVVACSITPTRVAVLLAADADRADVLGALRALLADAHLAREVRVLGGRVAPFTLPVPAEPVGAGAGLAAGVGPGLRDRKRRPSRARRVPLAAGATAGSLMLTAAALVAALSATDDDPDGPVALRPTTSGAPVGTGGSPSSSVLAVAPTVAPTTAAVADVAPPATGAPDVVDDVEVAAAPVAARPQATIRRPNAPRPVTTATTLAPAPAPAPVAAPAPAPANEAVVGVASECSPPPPPRAEGQPSSANGPGEHGNGAPDGPCDPPQRSSWPGAAGRAR